jgi:hypothetical protein
MAQKGGMKDLSARSTPSIAGVGTRQAWARNPWLAIVGLWVWGVLPALFCWFQVQQLWAEYLSERWTAAEGTITSSQVIFKTVNQGAKSGPIPAWCVSWRYTYTWQRTLQVGSIDDDTIGPLSKGCFVYREAAERAASRRAPGSTVPVRIDPLQPSRSTTGPVGIQRGDVLALIVGAIPVGLFVALAMTSLRRWSKRRAA